MKKIGWENGTLVSKGKVTISGNVYEVEPEQYEGKTPLSAENLKKMEDNIEESINKTLQLVFPIGSTYITQNTTNPNSILGFGTWERLKGKICLGLDEDDSNMNVIGKTGGEKKHVLTQSEAPSNTVFSDGGEGNVWAPGKWDTYNGYTLKDGGGEAHNNMPPYEVVGFMWIRRS